MTITYIDIEELLASYNTTEICLRFGNKNPDNHYMELRIHKDIAEHALLDYTIKRAIETGETKNNKIVRLENGDNLAALTENYKKIGLMDKNGNWNHGQRGISLDGEVPA